MKYLVIITLIIIQLIPLLKGERKEKDNAWSSSVSGRIDSDNFDEWVLVTKKILSKQQLENHNNNIHNTPILHVKTSIIGRYYIYVFQGEAKMIRKAFKSHHDDDEFIIFTRNHRIEIGPGHGEKYKNYNHYKYKKQYFGAYIDNFDKRRLIKQNRHGVKYHKYHYNNQQQHIYGNEEAPCRNAPQHANRGFVDGYFSWALDRADQRKRILNGEFCGRYTGENVHAYVMDTGVTNHNTFKHFVRQDYSYFTQNNKPNGDGHGHGTHVAGLIASDTYGVAPDVIIHSVQILNDKGAGNFASMISGLLYIEENKIDDKRILINMSLGAHGASSLSVESIIGRLVNDHGIPIIVSAGNYDDDACSTFPANIEDVITIGATDTFDRKPSFSNDGPCVDLFSPGVDIISCHNDGTNARILSGTSMSSPIVCGIAATLLEENPNRSPEDIRQILKDRATKGVIATGNLRSGTPNSLSYVGPDNDNSNNGGGGGGSNGGGGSSSGVSIQITYMNLPLLFIVIMTFLN